MRQRQRMDNSERDREDMSNEGIHREMKTNGGQRMYRVSERGREIGWGRMTAVELIVILIDEVIPGTIPKLECPREVFTRSSKSQSASEKDDIACNFSLFCFC